MAVTLSVGLQKKVGLPDFGSLGASCHVEFEIDRSLIDHDMEGFQRKVASAFAACRQAVNDQLVQPSGYLPSNGNGHAGDNTNRNGHAYSNGNGVRQKAGRATQSQVRAIFAIARQQKFDPATVFTNDSTSTSGPRHRSPPELNPQSKSSRRSIARSRRRRRSRTCGSAAA